MACDIRHKFQNRDDAPAANRFQADPPLQPRLTFRACATDMSSKPSKPRQQPLTPEQFKVLRAVAHTNLSVASTIAQHTGVSAHDVLLALRESGHVREHVARQRNGSPTTTFSITPKGEDVLRQMESAASAEGAPPTGAMSTVAAPANSPPREVYSGSEMRAYTGRPGSMDAFNYPSRIGDRLHHRDGSVTPLSPRE